MNCLVRQLVCTHVRRKLMLPVANSISYRTTIKHSRVVSDAENQQRRDDKNRVAHLTDDDRDKKSQIKETKSIFINEDYDTFGTLGGKTVDDMLREMPEEEDDIVRYDTVDETGKRKTKNVEYYVGLIKKLIQEKRIVDAIDILETKMLKEDHVRPNYYVYNLLIAACGNVGYTRKAFQLYNDMKRRDIKTTPATYTSLFNACGNSPYRAYSLKQAHHLREIMVEKFIEPNIYNYHAMIKAFGRCKDHMMAFSLVDEMCQKRLPLSSTTFAFLLQACISEKEAGFRHALLVWRKMTIRRIKPDIYTYNLLLRCARDCGLGDEQSTLQVVEQITNTSLTAHEIISSSQSEEIKLLDERKEENFDNTTPKKNLPSVVLNESMELENIPNLISRKPHLGSIISLSEIKEPEDRLILMGGLRGVLKQMEEDGVKPTIKTYTILLDLIPGTLSAEQLLLKDMKEKEVEMKIDFCNMLIKKRSMRCDYANAKEVLKLIQQHYLTPDIVTFGVLALGCKNKTEAESLMAEMNAFGYRLNAEILGAMLKQACYHISFGYITFIMRLMLRMEIKPNKEFLGHLENFRKNLRKWKRNAKIRDKKGKEIRGKKGKEDLPKFVKTDWFMEGSKMFQEYYSIWIKEITPYKEPRPWDQFKKKDKNRTTSEGNEDDTRPNTSANKKTSAFKNNRTQNVM